MIESLILTAGIYIISILLYYLLCYSLKTNKKANIYNVNWYKSRHILAFIPLVNTAIVGTLFFIKSMIVLNKLDKLLTRLDKI